MNNVQLGITVGLLVLLLLINQLAGGGYRCANCIGGLPWYGWVSGFAVLFIAGLVFARKRGERAQPAPAQPAEQKEDEKWNEGLRRKYDWDGPDYPHPVIVAERCIGCHACVVSCPHDVLTISYTEKHQPVASVVDHDLCMEDTSCEAACPVNPKACVVVNTAKQIRSLPAPWRDHSYMSSEPGCHIIGEVSGTPLIKNAANEGVTVMNHLAHELRADAGKGSQPTVDYEVAIIGAGPAGLSAAVRAKKLGLNYICIERDTVMATLANFYPEGKYVYFKPETTEWAGSIHLPGLEEYIEEVLQEFLDEPHKAKDLLASEREGGLDQAGKDVLAEARDRYQRMLDAELTGKLDEPGRERLAGARRKFEALLDAEEKYFLAELLEEERQLKSEDKELAPAKKNKLGLARRDYADPLEAALESGKLSEEHFQALAQARCNVAGHQREVLLNTWGMNAKDSDVCVNEKETCTGVKKVEDGDHFYFIVRTEKEEGAGGDKKKDENSYRVRRVVLAIGNSSSPMKLKVKGEGMKVRRGEGDEESEKVLYRLSDPKAYTNLDLIVVGGGNSAVEAAVDLAARRKGVEIVPREGEEENRVTLLVRTSGFKTDVKFGNKRQLYQCIDRGLITLLLDTEIKEIRDNEVVTTDRVTGKEETITPNDFIFALIGSERPADLLKQIKVKIIG